VNGGAPPPVPSVAAEGRGDEAPLLEVDAIEVAYGDVEVLHGVSLTVREGEIVTLLGSNGAGKTTTLRAISGLRPPRRGDVRFRGRSLGGVPASSRADLGIALVPEGRELWGGLTVGENLELGAYGRRSRRGAAKNLERVFALFPRLAERRRERAGNLSGGERRMLAIGLTLLLAPKLLLLDEPSSDLAPAMVDQVFAAIREIHRTRDIPILLVEQNVDKALDLADRVCVLVRGREALDAPANEIDPARLHALFLEGGVRTS